MAVSIKEEKVDSESVVNNNEDLDVSGQRYRLIIETFDCCPQVLLFLVSFQSREISDCEEAHTERARNETELPLPSMFFQRQDISRSHNRFYHLFQHLH